MPKVGTTSSSPLDQAFAKAATKSAPKKSEPLWKGPEKDGITFSLLCKFLNDRERFRLLVVEGLKAADQFNHKLEYGNMWHVCEEAFAKEKDPKVGLYNAINLHLPLYGQKLMAKYRMAQQDIEHWMNVCMIQFPIYVKYWSQHPDVTSRTPLLQEHVFDVPYTLPSGRVVRLLGKWDSVDRIGDGIESGIYLQENKAKGDIDPIQLSRQLTFDLQTMMYLTALQADHEATDPVADIKGVRYNVIRRPLSGGKGTIKKHEPSKKNPQGETWESYYKRLEGVIDGTGENSPGIDHFFMRPKVELLPNDLPNFQRTCLHPILEQLCDWWQWVSTAHQAGVSPFNPDDGTDRMINGKDRGGIPSHIHWRHPFGVYNALTEMGSTEYDAYLASGSEAGLQRTDDLFPELQGV